MKLAHRIAWNVFAGATGKIVLVLLGLLILGTVTRSLGPADFGHYRTALTYLALVAMFANFGTNTLALRDISRNDIKQEKVIGNAITFRLALTTLVLLIGAAIAPLFNFDTIVIKGVLVGLYGYTAFLLNEVTAAVFYNKLKQYQASAAEIIGTAFTCALVLLFANMDMGLLAMLGALASGQLLTALVAGILANRSIPIRPDFDWDYWRYLLKAGWPIGASTIIYLIILRGDTLLLALYKPATDVGFYGVGAKIFEILTSVASLFANLMMPLFVKTVNQPEKFNDYTNASLNAMSLAAVFVFCVLFTFSEEIALLVAGNQYGQSSVVIRILAPAIIIVYITILFRFALTSLGKQQTMFKADVFGLAIAIPAYLILIPTESYQGAALARVAIYTAVLLAAGTAMIRAGKINFVLLNILKLSLTGLLTVWVFTALQYRDFHWMLNIILGGILYLAISLLFGIISTDRIPFYNRNKSEL